MNGVDLMIYIEKNDKPNIIEKILNLINPIKKKHRKKQNIREILIVLLIICMISPCLLMKNVCWQL